jgi:hypothetical protein
VWLICGLLGGFVIWAAWLVLIIGFAIFWKPIFKWISDFQSIFNDQEVKEGSFERLIIIGVGLLVSIALIKSLAPPLAWDSLMYHLEIPKQYIDQGKFQFIPENYYWGQSQLVEILYSWSGILFRWETATTLSWFMVMLFLVGVFDTVKKISLSGAWVSIAALLAGETFRYSMGNGYVDGVSALFGYSVWVVSTDWLMNDNQKVFKWVGIFLGLTLWVKITNGILFPIVFISLLLFKNWKLKSWWKGIQAILIGLLIFMPWLLLLYKYTGNPLYPHFFETNWVSSARYSFFQREGLNPGNTALWLPLALTWHGLDTIFIKGKLIFSSDIGPLLLSFGLIGLVTGWKEKLIKLSTTWLLGGLLIMIVGGSSSVILWQTRLYYVLITPAAILVGFGWKHIAQIKIPQIRLQKVLGAIIILVLLLSTVKDVDSLVKSQSLGFLMGTTSRESYLERNLGWYYRAVQLIKDKPDSSKILLLWEPRGFYLPANAFPDVWIDRWYVSMRELDSVEIVVEHWKEQQITHILINLKGMEFEKLTKADYPEEDWLMLESLLNSLSPPEMIGDAYALYSLY